VLIEIFASLDLSVEFARCSPSGRADLVDRQCNGAMAAAKKLDRNPREVAGAIASALSLRPEFSEVSVAGPGFVNMRLSAAFLAQNVIQDPCYRYALGRPMPCAFCLMLSTVALTLFTASSRAAIAFVTSSTRIHSMTLTSLRVSS
jgi:Arginyl tRNA synthetase N terminal domain